MTNSESILADSINQFPHLVAFDLLAKKRMNALELNKLLIYLIDSVESSALPYLAEQFDVLGYKGYKLTTTESERRELIKKSIELHRYKGTKWAVEESLKAIGFPEAKIVENVNGHWAKFRIEMNLGERPISPDEIEEIQKMVEEYKNARSKLEDISYSLSFESSIQTIDDLESSPSTLDSDNVLVGGNFKRNGTFTRNGTQNYSKDSDLLIIEILIT